MTKNLSKPILDELKKQIKATGSGLVKCETKEQAELLFNWLDGKLPKGYGVWIIDAKGRENEINVYKIIDGDSDTGRTFDWLNSGSPKAIKMPAAFKKWKQSRKL